MILFDTGPTRPVMFDASGGGNHALTYVGWGSGSLAAGQEQRWSAQPFSLEPGSWDLTQIDANYFDLSPASPPDRIGIKIWSRSGQAAPGVVDEVFTGDVAAPTLIADPRITGGGLWLGILDVTGLSINLSGGDYYPSLYGILSSGASGGGIGWLANPEDGINLVDPATNDAFMWRSLTYPSPGFAQYTLPSTVLQQQHGLDPNDRYGAAFTIHGIPTPGTLAMLAFGGIVAMRRRR